MAGQQLVGKMNFGSCTWLNMFEVGRDFWKLSCPSPKLKQGHMGQVAQDCVHMAFEYHQRWRFHSLPGQLCLSSVLLMSGLNKRARNWYFLGKIVKSNEKLGTPPMRKNTTSLSKESFVLMINLSVLVSLGLMKYSE